jgi:hypothetical protein
MSETLEKKVFSKIETLFCRQYSFNKKWFTNDPSSYFYNYVLTIWDDFSIIDNNLFLQNVLSDLNFKFYLKHASDSNESKSSEYNPQPIYLKEKIDSETHSFFSVSLDSVLLPQYDIFSSNDLTRFKETKNIQLDYVDLHNFLNILYSNVKYFQILQQVQRQYFSGVSEGPGVVEVSKSNLVFQKLEQILKNFNGEKRRNLLYLRAFQNLVYRFLNLKESSSGQILDDQIEFLLKELESTENTDSIQFLNKLIPYETATDFGNVGVEGALSTEKKNETAAVNMNWTIEELREMNKKELKKIAKQLFQKSKNVCSGHSKLNTPYLIRNWIIACQEKLRQESVSITATTPTYMGGGERHEIFSEQHEIYPRVFVSHRECLMLKERLLKVGILEINECLGLRNLNISDTALRRMHPMFQTVNFSGFPTFFQAVVLLLQVFDPVSKQKLEDAGTVVDNLLDVVNILKTSVCYWTYSSDNGELRFSKVVYEGVTSKLPLCVLVVLRGQANAKNIVIPLIPRTIENACA